MSPLIRAPVAFRAKGIPLHIYLLAFSALVSLFYFNDLHTTFLTDPWTRKVLSDRDVALQRCKYLKSTPGPPQDFYSRTFSDRFESGTKSVLLKNARIWTGARGGTEIVFGDILLENGLIKAVGYIPPQLLKNEELQVQDSKGAWITPGIVDLHSHLGVGSSPSLRGSSDTNSRKAPILPWLRTIDGLNTHDSSYELAIAGGVTSAQILPGSANNIGGQAFFIKLRRTTEGSPTSKVIEPPFSLNGTNIDYSARPRWRHMKHACGENPSRVYSQTRMDSAWNFRHAYDEARKLVESQDEFCAKAESGQWDGLGEFPDDLQWEALADVLRGRVKLSVHCYEAVDLDGIVRLSNEFKFPVASFHHAGETYLVPDLLKKTWGGAPAIALFASNFRKKREAYRGSEFAPRVLADNGIRVVMKSDHPVINSRYLLNEAAVAHYYGLNPNLALAAVTSTPAEAAGLGHRIGTIREGYDADVVVWDSHPLTLGATPTQVYIDGIPQLTSPHISTKPAHAQDVPQTPNFDKEAKEAVEYEGLPPLEPRQLRNVAFTNVRTIYETRADGTISASRFAEDSLRTVLVVNGRISRISDQLSIWETTAMYGDLEVIDTKGGTLAPGLATFGAPLGLVEIRLEASTNDGVVLDPLEGDIPSILGGYQTVIRAVDGLQFGGRNTLLAYRGGVVAAVTPPTGNGMFWGLSTGFSTGALNGVEEGAILQDEVAYHVALSRSGGPSVSTQIAALRKLLFDYKIEGALSVVFEKIRKGKTILVIHVDNSDIMATVLRLKAEYESYTSGSLKITFAGGSEAHLLAPEIAKANVSVIVAPSRPFPATWEQKRILPGPPLSQDSAIKKLLKHGVNVAIGQVDEFAARNTRFDLGWAALESQGGITTEEALALGSTNLYRALGLDIRGNDAAVVYEGGDVFSFESKVIGVLSGRKPFVDLFI